MATMRTLGCKKKKHRWTENTYTCVLKFSDVHCEILLELKCHNHCMFLRQNLNTTRCYLCSNWTHRQSVFKQSQVSDSVQILSTLLRLALKPKNLHKNCQPACLGEYSQPDSQWRKATQVYSISALCLKVTAA